MKTKKANQTLTRSHKITYQMNLMAGTVIWDTDSSAFYLSVAIDMLQILKEAKIISYPKHIKNDGNMIQSNSGVQNFNVIDKM